MVACQVTVSGAVVRGVDRRCHRGLALPGVGDEHHHLLHFLLGVIAVPEGARALVGRVRKAWEERGRRWSVRLRRRSRRRLRMHGGGMSLRSPELRGLSLRDVFHRLHGFERLNLSFDHAVLERLRGRLAFPRAEPELGVVEVAIDQRLGEESSAATK
jgi:hypothetical protein